MQRRERTVGKRVEAGGKKRTAIDSATKIEAKGGQIAFLYRRKAGQDTRQTAVARLVAGLMRSLGVRRLALVEDVVQAALVQARVRNRFLPIGSGIQGRVASGTMNGKRGARLLTDFWSAVIS